jgi:hypothetical protein
MNKKTRKELHDHAISMSFHADMLFKLDKVFDEMLETYLIEKPDISFKEARESLFHDMKFSALFLESEMRKKKFEKKRKEVFSLNCAELPE